MGYAEYTQLELNLQSGFAISMQYFTHLLWARHSLAEIT